MKLWPIPRRQRWLLLGMTLALALALTVLYYGLLSDKPGTAPSEAGPASMPTLPPPAPPAQNPPPAPLAEALDIFAVRTWEPPTPVEDAATAAPPPPPQAPPLPFRYAGKLEEAGLPPIFFLLQGEQILAVRPGDLIDGKYRVGKLEGDQLHFLYRPLKIKQSLPVGGDS